MQDATQRSLENDRRTNGDLSLTVAKAIGLILGLTEVDFGGDPAPYFSLQDSWLEVSGVIETSPETLGNNPPVDLSGANIEIDDSGENRTLHIGGTISAVGGAKFTANPHLAVPATSKVSGLINRADG